MSRSPKKWRYSRHTRRHYYEDDKYGYGWAERQADGAFYGASPRRTFQARTLREVKNLVESQFRRKSK